MIETQKTRITPTPVYEAQQAHPEANTIVPADGDSNRTEIVISPQTGWISINWEEMIAHRELLAFLIWRDISIRYKQTILGSAWASLAAVLDDVDFQFHLRAVREQR